MNWKELTVRYIKDLVKPRTIREVILKELQEAQLRKLDAESAVEYAVSPYNATLLVQAWSTPQPQGDIHV